MIFLPQLNITQKIAKKLMHKFKFINLEGRGIQFHLVDDVLFTKIYFGNCVYFMMLSSVRTYLGLNLLSKSHIVLFNFDERKI